MVARISPTNSTEVICGANAAIKNAFDLTKPEAPQSHLQDKNYHEHQELNIDDFKLLINEDDGIKK